MKPFAGPVGILSDSNRVQKSQLLDAIVKRLVDQFIAAVTPAVAASFNTDQPAGNRFITCWTINRG
jgi:hypothetical protein